MEFEALLELIGSVKVEDFFFPDQTTFLHQKYLVAEPILGEPPLLPTYYLYDNNSAEFSFQFCNLDRPGDFRAPIIVGVPQHIFIQEHKAKKNQGSEK